MVQQNVGSKTRGFAWFVFPSSPPMTNDTPFRPDTAGGITAPASVEDFWTIGRNVPGIHNRSTVEGRSYLVVTTAAEPPALTAGWEAEPARLDESFQIDQRGDRWVRLVRIIETRDTDRGPLQDCEFEVDRT